MGVEFGVGFMLVFEQKLGPTYGFFLHKMVQDITALGYSGVFLQ